MLAGCGVCYFVCFVVFALVGCRGVLGLGICVPMLSCLC